MRWKADLPKMPRLPSVPPDDAAAPLGPPPAPSAYRAQNPSEPPPADYKAPSMLAEHKGLALLFLAAAIGFALYCWKAPPPRSAAVDAPARAESAPPPAAARARGPERSQSPIYVEPLPEKER